MTKRVESPIEQMLLDCLISVGNQTFGGGVHLWLEADRPNADAVIAPQYEINQHRVEAYELCSREISQQMQRQGSP